MPRPQVLAVPLAAALVLAACTSTDRPSVQADEVALPTPMRSIDPSAQRSIAAVESALSAVGERLVLPTAAYRPSEPPALLQLPRTIRRVDLADPDDGYVVIYQAPGSGAAIELADDLADYLESGFGQTNYVADTQFAVSTLGDTIIFTTWSQRRSDDPDRAEAAFEAIAAVGSPVPIDK
ncbi:MAG: hypothetical protein AB1Z67_10445 [Candidatus Limnocylindrales bacterium]